MLEQYQINPSIDHFAVFGFPVEHSKSPQIHTLFAEQLGLSLKYLAIPVEPEKFEQAVKEFAASAGKGLNITVPFKENAFRLCDVVSERARYCQSVNTIWFNNNKICGDTTDGQGLVNDLIMNHQLMLDEYHILIMGAGGTVRSIVEPLLSQNPKGLTIVNRTVSKAEALSSQFADKGDIQTCGYSDLKGHQYDLVINATSTSLHSTLPPLPEGILSERACCYDLMYGDLNTPFLQWAKTGGSKYILDGLGMLVEQAALSFQIWHQHKPDTKAVIEKLRPA